MQPRTAVVSGEGVRLDLAPAGVASRLLAAAVDVAIQFLALIVLVLIDSAVAGGSDQDGLRAAVIVEAVLVLAGYPIVMEWLARGRTVGKIALGLRVVRDDAGPIGFRQALVRGLAGLVLEKPGLLFPITTVVGLTVISTSSREKRLGDMLAGTVVLNERTGPVPLAPAPDWVPPALQPWVLALDLHALDDRLALAVRQFVGRAHAMSRQGRHELGEALRDDVLACTAPPPPPGVPTPDLLMAVLAERRRRTRPGAFGAPLQAPLPAGPPSPPPPTAPPSSLPPGSGRQAGPFAAPS